MESLQVPFFLPHLWPQPVFVHQARVPAAELGSRWHRREGEGGETGRWWWWLGGRLLSSGRWRAPQKHAAWMIPFNPPSSLRRGHRHRPHFTHAQTEAQKGTAAQGRTAARRACSCFRTSGVWFFTFVLPTRGTCPFPRMHSCVKGHPGSSLSKAHLASADRHEISFSRVPLPLLLPVPWCSVGHASTHSGEFCGRPGVSMAAAGRAGLPPRHVVLSSMGIGLFFLWQSSTIVWWEDVIH